MVTSFKMRGDNLLAISLQSDLIGNYMQA
jgi:hypothetical protein